VISRPLLATALLALTAGCGTLSPVGPDYAGPPAMAPGASTWQTRWFPRSTAGADAKAGAAGVATSAASQSPATTDAGRAEHAAQRAAAGVTDWWRQFDDPLLAELIATATQASSTLAQAAARIAQARAELTNAQADALPSLDGGASVNRSAFSFGGPVLLRTLSQLQAQSSWEIDLFGGLARSREAAVARVLAREAQRQDAQVALAAEVGNAYIGLRHCERQIRLIEADAQSRAQTAKLTELTGQAGLQAPSTVALARASAADAANRLIQQRAECDVLVKSLAVLSGQDEAALRPRLGGAFSRLPTPQMFRVEQLPADVLRQRPDLAALERELAAASADIGVAEAARYPRLTLTGSITPLRQTVSGSTVSATTWSIGPSLTVPLFDGGRRAASAEAARQSYGAAESAYRERVRVAVREVEEALLRLAAADEREQFAVAAANGYRDALAGAQTRYDAGLGSLVELEETRRIALQAETTLSTLQRDRVSAWVALYRAVGGGWTAPPWVSGPTTNTTLAGPKP
jgi:outer membrane protein, multidrug efflux system